MSQIKNPARFIMIALTIFLFAGCAHYENPALLYEPQPESAPADLTVVHIDDELIGFIIRAEQIYRNIVLGGFFNGYWDEESDEWVMSEYIERAPDLWVEHQWAYGGGFYMMRYRVLPSSGFTSVAGLNAALHKYWSEDFQVRSDNPMVYFADFMEIDGLLYYFPPMACGPLGINFIFETAQFEISEHTYGRTTVRADLYITAMGMLHRGTLQWEILGGRIVARDFDWGYTVEYILSPDSEEIHSPIYFEEADETKAQTEYPQQAAPLTQWQLLYAALLREYMEKPSPIEYLDTVSRHFFLHDIDKDGIPELFIFISQAGFGVEAIYTYRDGELIHIEGGFFIYYARAYVPPEGRPGIILANTMRHPAVPEAVFYWLMVIEGERLVSEVSLTRAYEDWIQWWGGRETPRESGWFIDDRQVTEEEFNSVYDSVFRGWDEGEELFPFSTITEENIHKIIFGWGN